MKLQIPHSNFDTTIANIGFPAGYFTVGGLVKDVDSKKIPPMLVVGGNTYTRANIPASILQEYDAFLLFYQTTQAVWKTGVFLAHKQDCRIYYSVYNDSLVIGESLKNCFKCLEDIVETGKERDLTSITKNEIKFATWVTSWLYKLPKISMKDILHLENYKEEKSIKNG